MGPNIICFEYDILFYNFYLLIKYFILGQLREYYLNKHQFMVKGNILGLDQLIPKGEKMSSISPLSLTYLHMYYVTMVKNLPLASIVT